MLYVATLLTLSWFRFPLEQWSGLICVTIATAVVLAVHEKQGWDLGLAASPRLIVRDISGGAIFGGGLVAAAAAGIVWTSQMRHLPGAGFPWTEVAAVYLPAVVHEELLFRGYPFQKLRRWNRGFAIVLVSLIFAALHTGNRGVTPLGLTNIFLGGVLLALCYERSQKLWFPLGVHLAWNLMAGPILGHEVSGYVPNPSLFVETGSGAWWITGGTFGIEGSLWMTVTETFGIFLLLAGPVKSWKERAVRDE